MARQMTRWAVCALLCAGTLVVQACASTAAKGPAPAAHKPAEGADQTTDHTGAATAVAGQPGAEWTPGTPMSLEQARAIVAEIESTWPSREDSALMHPTSYADVEQILKLDQVNLYPGAVAFIATQTGPQARALHAQIEMAWAETYILMVQILDNLEKRYTPRLAELEKKMAAGPLRDDEQRERSTIVLVLPQLQRNREAFKKLAFEHIVTGQEKAEKVMADYPDNYLGYRVAADMYQMLRGWDQFGEMVQKIEQTNPKSNGLVFCRGAEAIERYSDAAKAADYFHQALKNDPQFVRAQAYLLMIQKEPPGMYAELMNLEKLNHNHQLIMWAGKSIQKAYELWEAQQHASSSP
jgi:tetratricopeptide (TPR) repeat protein